MYVVTQNTWLSIDIGDGPQAKHLFDNIHGSESRMGWIHDPLEPFETIY